MVYGPGEEAQSPHIKSSYSSFIYSITIHLLSPTMTILCPKV